MPSGAAPVFVDDEKHQAVVVEQKASTVSTSGTSANGELPALKKSPSGYA